MALEPERTVSLSGLTEQEAKEFHGVFVASFTLFTLGAVFVHILTYIWRPWPWPAETEVSSLGESLPAVATLISPLIG